jgi:hypothetical protein
MLDRVGRCGMERLEHLPANSASGVRPHRRRVLSSRPDAIRHWLGRPSCRYPGDDSTELARGYEAQCVDSELLEMGTMHLASLGQIQVRGLSPPQSPLHHRMRNTKALRKRSIRPIPRINE